MEKMLYSSIIVSLHQVLGLSHFKVGTLLIHLLWMLSEELTVLVLDAGHSLLGPNGLLMPLKQFSMLQMPIIISSDLT
jgi:hypothetical protein